MDRMPRPLTVRFSRTVEYDFLKENFGIILLQNSIMKNSWRNRACRGGKCEEGLSLLPATWERSTPPREVKILLLVRFYARFDCQRVSGPSWGEGEVERRLPLPPHPGPGLTSNRPQSSKKIKIIIYFDSISSLLLALSASLASLPSSPPPLTLH